MKQLIQSYKTGDLGLFDVPSPACGDDGILVQTTASLVSAGTEKMLVDLAKKSLVGKAKARPDLVKQVITKMKQEGCAIRWRRSSRSSKHPFLWATAVPGGW